MEPNEAYKLVIKRAPNREPISCFDCGDYYLFGTISKNKKEFKGPELDSAYIVNKNDKKVAVYNPILAKIPKEKKRILVFK